MEESKSIELQQKQNGSLLLAEAKSIKIVDQQSNELASSFSTKTRAAIKTIEEWMNPQIEAANKTHKLLTGKRAELKKPFQDAQAIVDAEIGRYFMEQRRIKAEQEAILAAEAEKQRLQAQEALIAQALDTNSEELLVAAENVFVPEIKLAEPERTTKTEAGSTNVRMDIEVTVDNRQTLIEHIANRKDPIVPNQFLAIDLAYAKKWCKMMNVHGNEIPGLIIKQVPVVSGRTR
jgi:hypothetical protein